MALFRKKPHPDSSPPDEVLPFFTRDQADRFRRTLAAAFAETGLEMQVFADHLVDERGRQFGVYNVAAVCFNDGRGERAWAELTAQHVRRLLVGMDGPNELETMPTEQVQRQVFPRLSEKQLLPGLHLAYAVEFAEGVDELLNLDLPESVVILTDEHVALHGGRAALRAAGIRNLLGVLPDLEVDELRGGDAHQLVVSGDSMFTATTVLVMPELLTRIGAGAAPHGVLVCMPFRHQVALHVIRDASVVPSLNAMVGFARTGFDEGVGPLTPHVFWWHQGSCEQLTRVGDEGEVIVQVGQELQAVLEAVCA